MSYLEMTNAPIDNASKMIISFWFREISKQQNKPPKIKQWPQGFWTSGNASTVMVPPNAQYSIGYDGEFKCCVLYWNSYGLVTGGLFFGDLFLGPALCSIPCAPPVVTNTFKATGNAIGGVADVDMSTYGVRTLLTFGDPNIPYTYNTWMSYDPGVIDAVDYTLPGLLSAGGIVLPITPPPYKVHPQGGPCGGQFKVRGYKLAGSKNAGTVPQSFIGLDDEGNFVINLQTNTKAEYKGYAFEQHTVTELWASQTHLEIKGPPYGYTQLGWPFPDGQWVSVGGYWNGYQFEYRDISNEVMQCCPESFAIVGKSSGLLDFAFGAPKIQDGGWHHVLFSFDISGTVAIETPSEPDTKFSTLFPSYSAGPPQLGAADCKAFLAVDDKNITGSDLQNSCGVHDGFRLPKLRGTETTQIFDCGPTAAYLRGNAIGGNVVLPRNAWLHGWGGNPKDGLIGEPYSGAASVSAIIDTTSTDPGYRCSSQLEVADCFGTANGDFSCSTWTGAIWPLYGGCRAVAPGPWHGTCQPSKPSVPHPATDFDSLKYSATNFTIPIKGHPIGIPCCQGDDPTETGATGEANNTGVEMAELQIWIGQSIDTGDRAMRRLFIGYPRDVDGNPDTSKPLQPVPPSIAAKTLGKPDILLHGTGNWKRGRNTGTSGIDENGKLKEEGQFERTGTVEKFKPDPKLGN